MCLAKTRPSVQEERIVRRPARSLGHRLSHRISKLVALAHDKSLKYKIAPHAALDRMSGSYAVGAVCFPAVSGRRGGDKLDLIRNAENGEHGVRQMRYVARLNDAPFVFDRDAQTEDLILRRDGERV
jgi:hypothetical protein